MDNIKELDINMLLTKYKDTVRNAPSPFYSDDEEMDEYYDKVFEYEAEIKRRVNN